MDLNTLLLLDTETSGLDPKKDPLIEVACANWSLEHRCMLSCWSALVSGSRNDAEAVNGIPAAALSKGPSAARVYERLIASSSVCDVVVAHHADFDRAFVPELNRPWVCSMEDIQWPGAKPGGYTSLIDLALANGLGIATAHRALSDVLLLARVFERMLEKGVDVRALLERGLRPKGTFLALTSYEEREITKANGFKWKPETKQWVRRMAIEDAAALPFKTRRLDEGA